MNYKVIKTISLVFALTATMFTFANDNTMVIKSLLATDGALINNVSNNGKWAVSNTYDNSNEYSYNINASKWDLTTGRRTFLATKEDGMSEANCISNDGSIVGGAYKDQPAYNLNGSWHVLQLPNGYTMGTVLDMTIVDNDTIFVGRVQDDDSFQRLEAAKWVNGKYSIARDTLDTDKNNDEAISNTCFAISNDGKIIVGGLNYNIWPYNTTFVINNNDARTISCAIDNASEWESMIMDPSISPDGKFLIADFHKVILKTNSNGIEYAEEEIIPLLYDIENSRAQLLNDIKNYSTTCIDNNGNIYLIKHIDEMPEAPIYNAYIYKDKKLINLKDMLVANGVDKDTMDANVLAPEFHNMGLISAVSDDGTSIVGCSGACAGYNWVVRLSGRDVATNHISYNDLSAYYIDNTIFLSGMIDHIEVYNINGSIVMKQDVETAFIPANLNNGIYIVKLYNNTSNKITTCKIIAR